MKEVLSRRYSRLLSENQPLPQLVVLDGGKGQLNAALEVFDQLGIRGQVAVIGIAKRLNEIYFPGDSVPLFIDKNSESLKVVQHLRDEALRFCIKHHRSVRSKSQTHSLLDDIAGIGPSTRQLLLKHFKSIKRLREAPDLEIIGLIGKSRGLKVINALKNNLS